MVNARHFAYIAAKLFRPRDAVEALFALIFSQVRDAHRVNSSAYASVWQTLGGFAHGVRHRAPLRNRRISRSYRRNFHTFMSPWWISRPLREVPRTLLLRATGRPARSPQGRRDAYWAARARFYPESAAVLDFRTDGEPRSVAVQALSSDAAPAA
jgi:hypothetical protein